jgi:hypothetical protein
MEGKITREEFAVIAGIKDEVLYANLK